MIASWGSVKDIPVPETYGGSGADPAIFRSSNGTWYFLKRRGSQIFEDTFGAVQCGTLAGRLKNGKMSALSGE